MRCIAAVLLMVGRGLEAPDVVASLLDIDAYPCKPQYTLAPEVRHRTDERHKPIFSLMPHNLNSKHIGVITLVIGSAR